jgi:hypothetical protein
VHDEAGSVGDETEMVDLGGIAAATVAERVPAALAAGVDIQFARRKASLPFLALSTRPHSIRPKENPGGDAGVFRSSLSMQNGGFAVVVGAARAPRQPHGSHKTHRWREMDSNPRSPIRAQWLSTLLLTCLSRRFPRL